MTDTPIDLESLPEDLALAVEIIRQLENLAYEPEIILQAMIYVCQDTLSKLPEAKHEQWKQRLAASLGSATKK